MHDQELMPIGQFAEAARVTVRTLRHYHAVGVIVPARVDPGTGYRSYHRSQLADMASVRLLRELDVPLDTIRAYRDGHRSLSSILEEERARLAAEAARAARGVAMIDQLARATELSAPEAEVIELEPSVALTVIGVAGADTLVADAARLISHLLRGAEDLGLDTTSPVIGEYPASLEGSVAVRMYLPLEAQASPREEAVGGAAGDMSPEPEGDGGPGRFVGGGVADGGVGAGRGRGPTRGTFGGAEAEGDAGDGVAGDPAGAEVRPGTAGAGKAGVDADDRAREASTGVASISRSSSPQGHYGRLVHTGPLESLPLAYHQLLGWLHRTGHPVHGPFLERYVDDPATTDPATLRTEVLHPVSVDR